MSKQSAVDTLIEILVQECGFDNETETAQRVILLAKQMEKEQKKEMYVKGIKNYDPTYPNETYGGNNE